MEPRTEEQKSRFHIDKLEPRIAPGAASFGLNTALDAALPTVSTTPAPVDFVINTVVTHNPQT
ncbi:MAG: hypothetical protein HY288_15295 [Planctomycetia bacterium]|nr:hypothetical protein [Planctomycetia bacterium]